MPEVAQHLERAQTRVGTGGLTAPADLLARSREHSLTGLREAPLQCSECPLALLQLAARNPPGEALRVRLDLGQLGHGYS